MADSCFVTRARRAAEEADIVVVNHALFFADLSLRMRGGDTELRVLPAYDAVIFDEAHALEDIATEHFGMTASTGRLLALADDVNEAVALADERVATFVGLSVSLRTRVEHLAEKVQAISQLDASGAQVQRLTAMSLVEAAPQVGAVLETLAALAALCPADDADLGGLHRRVLDASVSLDSVLRADDPSFVYWLEAKGRSLSFRAAPIEIGESLTTHLYDSIDSAVFTSATLKTAKGERASFGFAVQRLGLEARPWDAVEYESPFDFERQAALYIPEHLPEPNQPYWTLQFAREVYQLIKVSGGRAFVMFTSLRQLSEVHALVAPHLDCQVLKQGDASRRALLEAFVEQPSVLFASQAFWEGVDVSGDALSLVIIDRLPFSPPNDPLQAARMETVRARGGAPFADYQVPQAALSLRQGFGRLIRSASDRGVVALGDVRVLTRGYGPAFLESLPPAKRLTRIHEVRAWWADTFSESGTASFQKRR
jgi:ATP-dependent DNA helicase DinG